MFGLALPLRNVTRRLVKSPAFSIVSIVTLAVGIGANSVISYAASQRTREIGIRMALGARQANVSRMFLAHGLLLTVIGVGLGLGAAWALTRLMAALLFGVSALDPLTYSTVAAALGAVVLLACYVPARRASILNPIEALRRE